MSRSYGAFGVLLALALAASGCDDAASDTDDEAAHLHTDGGTDEDAVPCGDNYPSFRPGLTAPAGDLTVRLLTIDPEPPRQKKDNDWVIEVVDASGAPVAGASIVDVDTWMDVHKHGGRWTPDVTAKAEPGRFTLARLDFKMAGPWRVRLGVKASPTAAVTRTSLPICVE